MRMNQSGKRMNGHTSTRRGFTIVEIMVVVVIIGIIAAIIAPRIIGRIGQSKQSVAGANAASLMNAVRSFQIDCGSIEEGSSIDILWEKPGNIPEGKWKGPYVNNKDELLDPWGHKFVLQVPGTHNVDFDVISYGADGQQGGEGENADIVAGKKGN